MRRALNENPMVQMAVLGLAAVAFALIMFMTVLKGEPTPPAGEAIPAAEVAAADPAATPPVDPAAPVDPAGAPVDPAAPIDPAVPAPQAAAPPPAGADGLLPTNGLPEDVLVAYAKDRAIALLVVDPKAQGSAKIESFTRRLDSRDDVEVQVVKAKDVADYSRITTGVAVAQTPALVVIRPRKLTGSVPTASVSYGFRGPKSISVALDDALYEGKQIPSYP